jgi:hypothetical protein
MRALFVICLLTGCDSLLGIPDVARRHDAGTSDAAPRADGQPKAADASPGPDAMCTDMSCPAPVATGCQATEDCGVDGTGNGLDDDCDGIVDSGCACVPGSVEACFAGPPGRRGVGICHDGIATCMGGGQFGTWGPCVGGIVPAAAETCNGVDDDCDGCVDDGVTCCGAVLACPTSMPDAKPFTDYVIDGTKFYGGSTTSWSWTVAGGTCDEDVFKPSTGLASYAISGASTSTLTFRPTLSGDYTINMDAKNGSTDFACQLIVHVQAPGVRVELCWDRTGSTGVDLDLHVHRSGTTTPWFDGKTNAQQTTLTTSDISNDDCHFMNCEATPFFGSGNIPVGTAIDWGYPNTTPTDLCVGGPEGAAWTTLGYCRNPRLDVDNINQDAVPENMNIDAPSMGDSFRVMAHYFGNNGATDMTVHPVVNVFCGGRARATYGLGSDAVPGFDHAGSYGMGQMWRVADVAVTGVDGLGNTTCDVHAIHPPAQTTGYYVTTDDRTF